MSARKAFLLGAISAVGVAVAVGANVSRALTATSSTALRNFSVPRWSPDGRKIAFVGFGPKYFEIFVMNGDGSDQHQLTNSRHGFGNLFPAWSPDGRKIAFVSDRSTRVSTNRIYIMNTDGGNQRPLTSTCTALSRFPCASGDQTPSWSPDGHKIAFASDRSGFERIFVINADGSGQHALTQQPGKFYDESPAWSPDGRKIAFESNRTGHRLIYVMNADGSGQHALTRTRSGKYGDSNPAWSPDGRKIVFDSDRTGHSLIYVMNADGSGQHALTRTRPGKAR